MRKRRVLTEEQVERALRKWQARLGLSDWRIRLVYGPNTEDEDRAGLYAAPEYREATVYWDPARVDVHTMRECEEWCLHELLHAITWQLEKQAEHWAGDDEAKYETVRDIAEGVVTNLERAVLNVRKAA